jgi:2-polyprenyl-6-methoxyphenol hydroxylase-like FAD-dependent oxidoreductase
MAENEILVVGAGPVGLTAAIELARRGLPVRIVDRDPEPTAESRAGRDPPAQPRPARSRGGHRAAPRGRRAPRRSADRRRGPGPRDSLDLSQIPHRFNFLLSLPQDRTERILLAALAERGVAVEQGTEVTGLEPAPDGPAVVLRKPDGERSERFSWVIGADGAHSSVRKALGIPFPGAPTRSSGASRTSRSTGPWSRTRRGPSRSASAGPVPGPHRPEPPSADRQRPGRDRPRPRTWRITAVHWQSSFRVSHRQAERVGADRVWIIGDAAHIHSPAGGRGMNLGMEDAATLAERIAAGDLGSWAEERRAAAARWIAASDRLQRAATNDGALPRRILPRLIALALAVPPLRRRALENFIAL